MHTGQVSYANADGGLIESGQRIEGPRCRLRPAGRELALLDIGQKLERRLTLWAHSLARYWPIPMREIFGRDSFLSFRLDFEQFNGAAVSAADIELPAVDQ